MYASAVCLRKNAKSKPHRESCYLCLHSNRVVAHSPGCSCSVPHIHGSLAETEITKFREVKRQERKSWIKEEEEMVQSVLSVCQGSALACQ